MFVLILQKYIISLPLGNPLKEQKQIFQIQQNEAKSGLAGGKQVDYLQTWVRSNSWTRVYYEKPPASGHNKTWTWDFHVSSLAL